MALFPFRRPGIRKVRLLWILLQFGLILFSSTDIAGQASESAFQFYRSMGGFGGHLALVHLLAEKSVHFTLFFSMGVILYFTLQAPRRDKIVWVFLLCLLMGSSSEALQMLYPNRDPSLADVTLNAASGLLAAVLLAAAQAPPCKARA